MKLFNWIQELRGRNAGIYQFVKFAITGTIGAAFDFAIFAGLTRLAGWHYGPANFVSVFVAIVVTFVFNKYWTFQDKGKDELHKQTVKFFTVAGTNYFLQQFLLFVFVEYTPLERWLGSLEDVGAKVLAIGIVMFSNFFVNKYWTFRKTENRDTVA